MIDSTFICLIQHVYDWFNLRLIAMICVWPTGNQHVSDPFNLYMFWSTCFRLIQSVFVQSNLRLYMIDSGCIQVSQWMTHWTCQCIWLIHAVIDWFDLCYSVCSIWPVYDWSSLFQIGFKLACVLVWPIQHVPDPFDLNFIYFTWTQLIQPVFVTGKF